MYASETFTLLKVATNSVQYYTVATGIVYFISTLVSYFLIDIFGRKTLFIISLTLIALGYGTLTAFIYFGVRLCAFKNKEGKFLLPLKILFQNFQRLKEQCIYYSWLVFNSVSDQPSTFTPQRLCRFELVSNLPSGPIYSAGRYF